MQLSVTLDFINKIILYQGLGLVALFFVTAVWKLTRNLREGLSKRKESVWRKKFIRYLVNNKKTKFPNSFSFQCFLAEYTHNFKGKYRLTLDELYMSKGFLERDKRILHSFSRQRKLAALRRIDSLGIVLPLDFLEELLSDRDLYFSCAVLFHMIKTHHKKAAPFVFSFFHRNRNYSKGVLINLLKYYGKNDPSGLVFLLERVEDEYFQEALLTAIYYSPVEDVDESVFLVVKNSSPLENKIMALRILDQYKSSRTLTLMNFLAKQKSWILKIYIAKMMHSYRYDEVESLMEYLLEEESFHVRNAACRSLMNFRPFSNKAIENILTVVNHPSREILHHLLSVEQVEVDYVA